MVNALEIELKETNAKLQYLIDSTGTEEWANMDPEQVYLITAQIKHLTGYRDALQQRVEIS
ncbi:hypothetical protein HZI31_06650 [Serratia fonticola]|uniref:crAss001_48 related protein n=1 Tax=Serratia fonticola TaxID=47917 RepID=UPI0015C5EA42|nr:hypothetical protein [Serratia fonticola]NYA42985.1 hypothetical protein [Serratia fonticola]